MFLTWAVAQATAHFICGNLAVRALLLEVISRNAISFASNEYHSRYIDFVLLDGATLPYLTNSFDIVLSMEAIEHVPDWRRFLSECKRVLRNGGFFICSTPNKGHVSADRSKLGNVHHQKEFTVSEFREAISCYFNDLQVYGQEYWPSSERAFSLLGNKVSSFVFAIPHYRTVVNFFGQAFGRRFYRSTMEEMLNERPSFDASRFEPFLIRPSSPQPRQIIVVATKGY